MTWNITAKLRQGNKLNTDELEFLIQNANPNILPEERKEDLIKAVKSGNVPIDLLDFSAEHRTLYKCYDHGTKFPIRR